MLETILWLCGLILTSGLSYIVGRNQECRKWEPRVRNLSQALQHEMEYNEKGSYGVETSEPERVEGSAARDRVQSYLDAWGVEGGEVDQQDAAGLHGGTGYRGQAPRS